MALVAQIVSLVAGPREGIGRGGTLWRVVFSTRLRSVIAARLRGYVELTERNARVGERLPKFVELPRNGVSCAFIVRDELDRNDIVHDGELDLDRSQLTRVKPQSERT